MRSFATSAELAAQVGQPFEPSGWIDVTQDMIDRFADATGDYQWIHVDPERAAKEAPEGHTIAHGYLTLSLIGSTLPQIYEVKARTILNYGIDRLRFLSAVPSGSQVRLHTQVEQAEPISGGQRIISKMTFEIKGAEKPALVAQTIFVYLD